MTAPQRGVLPAYLELQVQYSYQVFHEHESIVGKSQFPRVHPQYLLRAKSPEESSVLFLLESSESSAASLDGSGANNCQLVCCEWYALDCSDDDRLMPICPTYHRRALREVSTITLLYEYEYRVSKMVSLSITKLPMPCKIDAV